MNTDFHTRFVPPGWKQMGSGKGIDLNNPRPEDVDFNDIAAALSLICRFNGALTHPSRFYSVAQHSVLVAELMEPRVQVYGLLHDAHEAYFGDDITPKKRLLAVAVPEAARWLEDMKAAWDAAIWSAARLAAPDEKLHEQIKAADTMALSIERMNLLAEPVDATTRAAWAFLPIPLSATIYPLPPVEAHGMFMSAMARMLWTGRDDAGSNART